MVRMGRLSFCGRSVVVLLEDNRIIRVILGEATGLSFPELSPAHLRPVEEEFRAYFEGERPFPDLPFRLEVSPSARRCLYLLREIPRGEVRTYGWVARRMGYPRAARAVGRILSANPLPLLFPCHRVVGQRGLGGFSAGREWKEFLLRLEGAL